MYLIFEIKLFILKKKNQGKKNFFCFVSKKKKKMKVSNKSKFNLDRSLREAEQLQISKKKDVSVGISQLSSFFSNISEKQEISDRGKGFLAMHRVDTTIAEKLLQELKSERTEVVKTKKEIKNDLNRYKSASEFKEEEISAKTFDMWDEIIDDTNSFLENAIPGEKSNPTIYDSSYSNLRETAAHQDYLLYEDNARKAAKFAKELKLLISRNYKDRISNTTKFFIELADKVIDKESIANYYFRAIEYCINNSREYTPKGAIEFLMYQYRISKGYNSIDDIFSALGPISDINSQLAISWELFRSGYITSEQNFTNDLASRYSLDPCIQSKLQIIANKWMKPFEPMEEEQVMDEEQYTKLANSAVFQIFTDIANNAEITMVSNDVNGIRIVQTAEDYLFILLFSLSYEEKTKLYDHLKGIKNIINEECIKNAKVEGNQDFKYVCPLFSILIGEFDLAVTQILEFADLYIEGCHVAFALYEYLSPTMRRIVDNTLNKFTNILLPNNFYSAVAYQFLVTNIRQLNKYGPDLERICNFLISHPQEALPSDLPKNFPAIFDVILKKPNLPPSVYAKLIVLRDPDTEELNTVVKYMQVFTLQQLTEIVISIGHIYEQQQKGKDSARLSFSKIDKTGSGKSPLMRYMEQPQIAILRTVLMRCNELSAADRIKVSTAGRAINDLPNDESLKNYPQIISTGMMLDLLDLYIALDSNNKNEIENLLFNKKVLPTRPDDVYSYLHNSFIEGKPSLLYTIAYNTIVYLFEKNKKSEEDLYMLSTLFRLCSLLDIPLDLSMTIRSIYEKCRPLTSLLVDIE